MDGQDASTISSIVSCVWVGWLMRAPSCSEILEVMHASHLTDAEIMDPYTYTFNKGGTGKKREEKHTPSHHITSHHRNITSHDLI